MTCHFCKLRWRGRHKLRSRWPMNWIQLKLYKLSSSDCHVANFEYVFWNVHLISFKMSYDSMRFIMYLAMNWWSDIGFKVKIGRKIDFGKAMTWHAETWYGSFILILINIDVWFKKFWWRGRSKSQCWKSVETALLLWFWPVSKKIDFDLNWKCASIYRQCMWTCLKCESMRFCWWTLAIKVDDDGFDGFDASLVEWWLLLDLFEILVKSCMWVGE